MKSELLERRISARLPIAQTLVCGEIAPPYRQIINLSRGGVCIEFSGTRPTILEFAVLRFHYAGHDVVVPSQLAWERPCADIFELDESKSRNCWHMGYKFTDDRQGDLIDVVPEHLLCSGGLSVSVADIDAHGDARNEITEQNNREWAALSEQSVHGFKLAANELLPIFAKHFTDAHIVLSHDRIEISAPFRHPGSSNSQDARRTHRMIEATKPMQRPAPATNDRPIELVHPTSAPATNWHRRSVIVSMSLVAVILGGMYLGVLRKPTPVQAKQYAPVEMHSIPDWAVGVRQDTLGEWIENKKMFNFADEEASRLIQILRANNKYSPGQELHDLTKHPLLVRRAFQLLVTAKVDTHIDFSGVMKHLKGLIVEGARFPDEPPGGQYSSLERPFFNNVVVLAVIEHLDREKNDPLVKKIVVALHRNRT